MKCFLQHALQVYCIRLERKEGELPIVDNFGIRGEAFADGVDLKCVTLGPLPLSAQEWVGVR